MIRIATCLAVALLLASSTPALAEEETPKRTCVQSGLNGVCFARCAPAAEGGTTGSTDVYAVGETDDLTPSSRSGRRRA